MTSNDSPGCFAICGLLIILLSLSGLWQVRLAVLHHTILYSFWRVAPWLDPWQGLLVFTLALALGIAILLAALKKMKK